MLRKLVVTLAATAALLVGTAAAASAAPAGPDFGAQARAAGLTATQAQNLQQRVDAVLDGIPGGRQVSATEVRYDGLNVTLDPVVTPRTAKTAAVSCSEGWFCITVNGTNFEFYTCKTWTLDNWTGNAPYNNDQSAGTLAEAFGKDGTTLVWSDTAKDSGTVNVTPWWYFRPC